MAVRQFDFCQRRQLQSVVTDVVLDVDEHKHNGSKPVSGGRASGRYLFTKGSPGAV